MAEAAAQNPRGAAALPPPNKKATPKGPELKAPDNGLRRGGLAQLQPGGLDQAEFMRTAWLAEVEQGVTHEDVLNPAFWAHHAARFTPRAHVEVWAKDGSWYAEYVVLDCSRTMARVKCINGPIALTEAPLPSTLAEKADLENEVERQISAIAGGHTIEFNPQDRWRVVRKTDDKVVAKMKTSRDEAEKWMRAHALHSLGRGPDPDLS